MKIPETLNAEFIDHQYQAWKKNPRSVPTDWQFFFKGFQFASETNVFASGETIRNDGTIRDGGTIRNGKTIRNDDTMRQSKVDALIHRYREIGHLLACMDPLSQCPTEHPLLELSAFGLSLDDLNDVFYSKGLTDPPKATLKEIISTLKMTYSRSVGVEYTHLQDPEERKWLRARMEPSSNQTSLEKDEKQHILKKLVQTALLEQFLNKKYIAVTRFSLEGGDGLIPIMDALINQMSENNCEEVILGMAHRGRLNVQAHILNRPYDEIFSEFENCYDPLNLVGSGDVKYHNGYLTDTPSQSGKSLRIFLANNPSHLEAVNPVVQGIARARQDTMKKGSKDKVVPILIHGDAAFAGQGVVAETLNMSQLKGYTTGGTVHIIINNQIGYTTLPEDSRSTRYSTDIAKMLAVPIFHVHGEDPEALVHVAKLAADYRNTYRKDIVIDLICYRKYGHNEGDEPYFTQPDMYDRIKKRPSLHTLYRETLLQENMITKTEADLIEKDASQQLEHAYDDIHGSECPFPQSTFYKVWDGYSGRFSFTPVKTNIAKEKLLSLSQRLNAVPEEFNLHPKLKNLFNKRVGAVKNETGIDWANAESMAFGSLVEEGHPIRLSGQDVGRGTFSQRHSVVFDRKSGKSHTMLNHLSNEETDLYAVYNSLLAEAAVLGFEYGYSIIAPKGLTIWEAQFGDFANNAQGIIDLFLVSGQAKWDRLSGLVLLLPHGWEGLGPEHSSARLERFLQLSAKNNIQVANVTTPAQYFHLLRRQALAPYRIPLIVMTPKSLLRHPLAISSLMDFSDKTFEPVLDDPHHPYDARKMILCSGKIYYQLMEHRQKAKKTDTVIIRVEQLYPFPQKDLKRILSRYKSIVKWLWVQEEPENMGAWWYIRERLESVINKPVFYIGRKASASPATGFPQIYKAEQTAISDQAIGVITEEHSIIG